MLVNVDASVLSRVLAVVYEFMRPTQASWFRIRKMELLLLQRLKALFWIKQPGSRNS